MISSWSAPSPAVYDRGRLDVIGHLGRARELAVDEQLRLDDERIPQVDAQPARDALDGDGREALEPGAALLVARVGRDLVERARVERERVGELAIEPAAVEL